MSAAKILLVEDDELFRSTLASALIRQAFEVTQAPNGKIAKDLMILHPYDLILSDIQMPHLTGIELLEWTRPRYKTPFVLMTGFAQILETKKAHDIGADDFIAKPFTIKEMIDVVTRLALGEEARRLEPKADLDRKFYKVAIADFVSEKETECSLYIRISSSKYIRIAHKGGKISEDRVKAYADKGIDSVYMEAEDFSRLLGFNMDFAKVVASSVQIDPAKKLRFIKHTSDLILEKAFVKGIDETSYREAADFLTSSIGMICEEGQTAEMLDVLSRHGDYVYAHSIGTSIISVMIGKELGWKSTATLFRLAMGGLLHDVGKKEIPRELLEKPRALMTQEERKIFESHPTRGREILASIGSMPSDVVQIVYEHHETLIGDGYPRGLGSGQIHPLSKVVQAANLFCDFAIKSGPDAAPKSAAEAVRHLFSFYSDSIDKDVFAALRKLFK